VSHSPPLARQCPHGRLVQPECAGKAIEAAYHVLDRSPKSLIGILGHIIWKVPVAFHRGKAWIRECHGWQDFRQRGRAEPPDLQVLPPIARWRTQEGSGREHHVEVGADVAVWIGPHFGVRSGRKTERYEITDLQARFLEGLTYGTCDEVLALIRKAAGQPSFAELRARL
jgi:hypothetical protein